MVRRYEVTVRGAVRHFHGVGPQENPKPYGGASLGPRGIVKENPAMESATAPSTLPNPPCRAGKRDTPHHAVAGGRHDGSASPSGDAIASIA